MTWCSLNIKENCHVLVNQFHGNFSSRTLCCRKIKYVFTDVKRCFNASWGFKWFKLTLFTTEAQPTWSVLIVIDQTWLAGGCHPEWEFRPLSFSHSWTIQGPESTCWSGNCRCFTEIRPKLYMTYSRFFSDLEKSSPPLPGRYTTALPQRIKTDGKIGPLTNTMIYRTQRSNPYPKSGLLSRIA